MINFKELAKNLENLGSGLQATGESGGGAVKLTINGKKEIIDVVIDDSLMEPSKKVFLQHLIIAAMNHAIDKINLSMFEEMKNQI